MAFNYCARVSTALLSLQNKQKNDKDRHTKAYAMGASPKDVFFRQRAATWSCSESRVNEIDLLNRILDHRDNIFVHMLICEWRMLFYSKFIYYTVYTLQINR